LSWVIVGVIILTCAILLEAYIKRGKRSKPLHEKFGSTEISKPPLGMEATDIKGFDLANQLNDNLARHSSVQTIQNPKTKFPTAIKKRSPEDHAKILHQRAKNRRRYWLNL
jgi:hypothetical protein